MTVLRPLIGLMFAIITLYTLLVFRNEGVDFLTPFIGPIADFGWRGQFNLDFGFYLLLSGLWLAWRSGFSAAGCLQGAFAASLGMMVFAPLVLLHAHRARGDLNRLLLGRQAAAQGPQVRAASALGG